MRLGQLIDTKEDTPNPVKSKNPDKDTVEVLKDLQKEMHETMLQADLVMRRLAQILDKL